MPSILVSTDGQVLTIALNRPEVRNAFDDGVIAEITAWARSVRRGSGRVAILRGAGKVFCAGADLAWMSRMVEYSHEENVRDATAMAEMFQALDELPVPLIGRVHGAALGGGAGLAAVCDIVVAAEDATFGFTEAKLGILPAVIAPFAVAKIGTSAARELFLTAARFDARRAHALGLVHGVAPEGSLDGVVNAYVSEVISSGPEAVSAAKALIRTVAGRPPRDVATLTAETIARHRTSPEGQAGMRAFLDRRQPPWIGGT
jgi:methylglutaconyl-CoA hydratase